MKKVIKKVVAKAPVKRTVAKKPMMKTGGSKKSLPKAQLAGQTPFQGYMKNTGAVASDTVMSRKQFTPTTFDRSTLEKPKPKNPQNTEALIKASEKTYGMDVWDRPWTTGTKNKYLTTEEEKGFRSMGPLQKKGGATKSTYKKGGVVKVTAKKVMMKKDGGNIDDPKSATPQQPKVYSSKKEFRKDLKNAKMNAKVEAAKSGQSKDWAGKAATAAGAGSAILGLVEGAKRLFQKNPSQKNGGYMKKGGVVKKVTAKKTIVKSKKK